MNNLNDIENTVVTNRNGLPILIKDIAKVGFGHATRFGAITANGEGEKVLGQVMMLKGGNSKKVIEAVHERIKSIEKSLPEGVYINGFLERSELIAKTTFTVYENLILGSLIVIFVVVLLLGNWRSGLVVASVIPIALLFTLGMMYLFGVDANLMSLGAIDFGIIIDGAVIIVEFVAFQITSKKAEFAQLEPLEKQDVKDDITYGAASKMMSSAIFGQLIILIVFIPILTLEGIEGKMFKPMAMTFSFALIGAMILGLTYVPALAASVIKPSNNSDKNISVRLMNFLNSIYEPVIRFALKSKRLIVGSALTILVISFYIFSTMGAEFIPTLDEGDFAIQPELKVGTSLKNVVETTTKIEKILKQFPEVKQVVSRIGAAEVPTDPMSMNDSDIIVTLNPKSEWKFAKTKEELATKFKEALSVFPNMEVEFTQPIEMRFNELISGTKSDIAIKIYGDDLEMLNKKANEIKKAIQNVQGAADIIVEKTAGLPQMNVKFNRTKIARYGLNIADINEMITMGFSGHTAGSVFEGEKKFDLVLRLDKANRNDINDLQNLYIDLPNGGKIPLSEVATVSYKKAAAKISRDDTKRRVVVGVNVRDRDLQSVVDDLKEVIDTKVKIPVGYSVTYGGQFKNLQSAKARLTIAVPIALILIFILLYFAFHSVKEALIIYSAIPFAAVGGIIFLWLRGLPFSISAGVGFIALFGIAVLNGIVLIEEFKELKHKGMKTDDELIIFGAKSRLRAVLLTALAAALGFLPMAISNGAGAEVQRPLATVVIGGLFTSTLLTLLVLPVLYAIFDSKKERKRFHLKNKGGKVITILIIMLSLGVNAQNAPLSLAELKQVAYTNNAQLKAVELKVKQAEVLAKAPSKIEKTELNYNYENDKITDNIGVLNTYEINQTFSLPSVYKANKNVAKAKVDVVKASYEYNKRNLDKTLELAYQNYLYQYQKEQIYQYLDSLYSNFSHNAKRKFELGESNYLEKITAQSKFRQIQMQFNKAKNELQQAQLKIKQLLQSEKDVAIAVTEMTVLSLATINMEENTGLKVFEAQEKVSQSKIKMTKKALLPDFNLGYSYGDNTFYDGSIQSFQVGLRLPLFRKNLKAKVEASKIENEIAQHNLVNYKLNLVSKQQQLLSDLNSYKETVNYYQNEGKTLSDAILKTANRSFKAGEIDFFQYIQSIENAYEMKLNYLENLYQFNQKVILINNINL